jgi:defect in organelle trafficking protein DotC
MTLYSKSMISLLALGVVMGGVILPSTSFAQSMLSPIFEDFREEEVPPPTPLEDIEVKELLRQENLTKEEVDARSEIAIPQTLEELQEIEGYKGGENDSDEDKEMPFDIRKESLKEAALSYGARGGLAARSYEINDQIDDRATYMDKVYDFRQLLISAPSGFMIEPPIISESLKALLIEGDGQKAAVADAIYSINENVKIVSAPRNWRNYLERTWGPVEKPPEILRPKNEKERAEWRINVKKGWEEGLEQADEVFAQDLNRLQMEFSGMVRYRQLLAQGMVSAPFAQQIDRGVTGEEATMRVGDRAVVITGVPELITESQRWQPANR